MEYCGELYRLDGHDCTGVIGAAIGPADELITAEGDGLNFNLLSMIKSDITGIGLYTAVVIIVDAQIALVR